MKTTNYAGIDYSGHTQTNRNPETGIRYGVIAQNDVMPEALDDVFQNGTDLDYENYIDEIKAKLKSALSDTFSDHAWDNKPSKLDLAVIDAFDAISDDVDDVYQGGSDCTRMEYEQDGYKLQTDSSGDLWVIESPYFTYAQFCSPCAPGACHLGNPLEIPMASDETPLTEWADKHTGNLCYCLGAHWFEDSKAPYVIYSVETGKPI